MLAKIKSIGEAAKSVLLYIVAPLLVFAFSIYALLSKNKELKTELQAKEGDEKLKELQGAQKEIDRSSDAAVSEFERLRAAYDRLYGRDQGSGKGDSSPKGSD